MDGMSGTSVKLSYDDFLEFSNVYNAGISVPGLTNTQIQIREIRENRSSNYI